MSHVKEQLGHRCRGMKSFPAFESPYADEISINLGGFGTCPSAPAALGQDRPVGDGMLETPGLGPPR